MKYDDVPQKLKNLKQWVSWNYEIKDGRKTKVLLKDEKSHASSTDPKTWDTFENVKTRKNDGIGFVFQKGIVGIDLDYAFYLTGEKKGQMKDWAKKFIEKFDSYTEYSPSRIDGVPKGVHIIGESDLDFTGINRKLPIEKREEKELEEGVECYMKGRFFTVTGNVYENKKELKKLNTEALQKWLDSFKKPIPSPYSGTTLPDDETILTRIRKSKNGAKFQTLFDLGNYQSLGFGSQSEADLSLVGSLMFWCCNDQNVVDRLFRRSKMMRDKWTEKHGEFTYGEMTMKHATRAQVMNWLDPYCEDKRDMLQTIEYKGDVSIVQNNEEYEVSTPIPPGKVTLTFTDLIITSQSIDANIRVNVIKDAEEQTPFVYKMDITSQSQQGNLVTALNKAYGTTKEGFNWTLILNRICSALTQRLQTEDVVLSGKGIPPSEPDFILYPFLQKNAVTVLYGYGDTGKSWLAFYLSACMSMGLNFFGYPTTKNTRVLFADYEDDFSTFTSRMHKISEGMNLKYDDVMENVLYKKYHGAVKDIYSQMKKHIIDNNIQVLIIDSGGQACGGSPNDEQKVIQLFGYLEHLPVTKLIIHHEPKSTMGIEDEKAFYGTSYWHSSSRLMYRLHTESKEDNRKTIKISKGKGNSVAEIPPIYYNLTFYDKISAEFEGRNKAYVTFVKTEREKTESKKDDKILEAIGDDGASMNQIQQAANVTRSTAQRRIEELQKNGLILTQKKGRNIVYFLRHQ